MESITRRLALKLVAAGVLLLGVPGRLLAYVVKNLPTRTVEVGDFRFDQASHSVVRKDGKAQPYALTVDGLVEEPRTFDYAALRSLPYAGQTSDFHCVEGWSVLDLKWGGVRLETLAGLVRPRPQARYVVFHALGRTQSPEIGLDHYVECLPLADLLRPDLGYLLALDMDGAPLTDGHGAPLRLVCPFDHAYKAIKFVTRLEFTDRPQDGWWTRANSIYPREAPVERDRLRVKDPRAS